MKQSLLATLEPLLEDGHLTRSKAALSIGGVAFPFEAVYFGGDRSLDLVLAIAPHERDRLASRLAALSRALDFVESRRPLTVISVGWEPSATETQSLSRTARLLVVRPGSSSEQVRDAILVLLPLRVPPPSSTGMSVSSELMSRLGKERGALSAARLLESETESSRVRDRLKAWLSNSFEGVVS